MKLCKSIYFKPDMIIHILYSGIVLIKGEEDLNIPLFFEKPY